jgi:cytidylate kinase
VEIYPWEIPIDDKLYLQTLKIAINELAKSQAIVIRGRGSQFILKDFPGAIHVLAVAPLDLRVQRVMEKMQMDEEQSKIEINFPRPYGRGIN